MMWNLCQPRRKCPPTSEILYSVKQGKKVLESVCSQYNSNWKKKKKKRNQNFHFHFQIRFFYKTNSNPMSKYHGRLGYVYFFVSWFSADILQFYSAEYNILQKLICYKHSLCIKFKFYYNFYGPKYKFSFAHFPM